MKNQIGVHSDGVSVFVSIHVRVTNVWKTILIIMILAILLVFITLISTIDVSEDIRLIFPILILFGLFVLIPVKYLLWNLFGKEHLIINTKTLNYCYDYGLITTKLRTVNHNKLGTGFLHFGKKGQNEIGKMLFYNYDKETNIPEVIHETTILVELEKLIEIDHYLQSIFENELFEENRFMGYSAN